MKEVTYILANQYGLDFREATQFVNVTKRFSSEISVVVAGSAGPRVNGKSEMGLMLLAAVKGARITIRAAGPDEEQVQVALEELIGSFSYDATVWRALDQIELYRLSRIVENHLTHLGPVVVAGSF